MRDFSTVVSFVAPIAHKPTTRSITTYGNSCCSLPSPTRFSVGSNFADRAGTISLRAEVSDVSGAASSVMSQSSEPAGVYEAVLPQTETLVGMGFILVLCVALYWVWENQVVPVSRTNLAISKSRGEVKEYLDELKESSGASSLSSESNASDDASLSLQVTNATAVGDETITRDPETAPSPTRDRAFERWLFTDWLQDNKSARAAGGRRKEPALPILKSARWNSGDNPVVVAAFLMLVGILITIVTERLSSLVG